MSKYAEVIEGADWLRASTDPETKCEARGHSERHPVRARAWVTEWFGRDYLARYDFSASGALLPVPVCGRHLNEAVRLRSALQRRMDLEAKTAQRATELREALAYLLETTGVALDAGLGNIGRPDLVFTLDPAQLRHLADAVADKAQPEPENPEAPGPAEAALAKVLEFPSRG